MPQDVSQLSTAYVLYVENVIDRRHLCLAKPSDGLQHLHTADEVDVNWFTSCGIQNIQEQPQ